MKNLIVLAILTMATVASSLLFSPTCFAFEFTKILTDSTGLTGPGVKNRRECHLKDREKVIALYFDGRPTIQRSHLSYKNDDPNDLIIDGDADIENLINSVPGVPPEPTPRGVPVVFYEVDLPKVKTLKQVINGKTVAEDKSPEAVILMRMLDSTCGPL